MTKKNSRKRKQQKAKKDHSFKAGLNQELKKDGIEQKNFRFNSFQQVFMRPSWFGTGVDTQCYLMAWCDVNGNGYTIYDSSGTPFGPTTYNPNFGTVWGTAQGSGTPVPGATDQFPEWAKLYSSYRVNKVGLRIAPFSMVTTGSQGPVASFTDPQGILAGLISRGASLPNPEFIGALGDTKTLRMTAPFKQVKKQLSYAHLIGLESSQSYLQTIDGGLDSGFRQLYDSFTRYGRAVTDPAVTGARMPAVVAIMPFSYTQSFTTTKAMCILQPWADITFMQRRTTLTTLTRGLIGFQEAELVKMKAKLDFERSQLSLLNPMCELPPAEFSEEETVDLSHSTMSALKAVLARK